MFQNEKCLHFFVYILRAFGRIATVMLDRLPITVGFEIEFELSGPISTVVDAMRAAGHSVNHNPGWRRTPGEVSGGGMWDVKTDSSCGYEAVTPIIRTMSELRRCASAANEIRRAGGRATSRCGLHFHFGLIDLNPGVVERIFNFFVRYESAFFMLVPAARRQNPYCKPLSETHLRGIHKISKMTRLLSAHNDHCGGFEELFRVFKETWSDKNVWMNGRTFPRIGTLEFRIFEGTLDPEQIVGFAVFMLQIFNEIITNGKRVSWGKASARDDRMLFYTMLQQANCFSRKNHLPHDADLSLEARRWATKVFKLHSGRRATRAGARPSAPPAIVVEDAEVHDAIEFDDSWIGADRHSRPH